MLRKLAKPAMPTAIIAALALSLAAGPLDIGLCGQDSSCSDNGCQGSGGACGAFTDNGPCICFFA